MDLPLFDLKNVNHCSESLMFILGNAEERKKWDGIVMGYGSPPDFSNFKIVEHMENQNASSSCKNNEISDSCNYIS